MTDCAALENADGHDGEVKVFVVSLGYITHLRVGLCERHLRAARTAGYFVEESK